MADFVATSWANVNAPSDSDCSWDASQRGFNYDSKYLIQVRGLPFSATKPQIAAFFENISILNGVDGIHFILNGSNMKDGQAFIQLESLRDYTAARKMNKKMDDRFIEGTQHRCHFIKDNTLNFFLWFQLCQRKNNGVLINSIIWFERIKFHRKSV